MIQRETLLELQQLRKDWQRQNFQYTREQQARYNELVELRRSHVRQYYADGRVWVGPSNAGKVMAETEA